MKRVAGGLAIAVPAYGVLAGAGSAKAAALPVSPDSCGGSCPPILIDQWCAGSSPPINPGNNSCKGPDVAACMQDWQPGGIKQEGWCFEP
jgi:hypothetical protein